MSKGGKKNGTPQDNKRDKGPAEGDNIGSRLRKLRTERGLSLKDVCDATRISESNLNAIEEQNYSALPADTFTRGLLTIYAKFLDVDPAEMVTGFMEARDESQTRSRRSRAKLPRNIVTPKKLAEPSHVSSMTMAGILLLVIVVIFTGFCVYTSWNPFNFFMQEAGNIQSIVTDIIPADQPAPSPDNITSSPAPIQKALAEAPKNYILTVRFLEDSGVEIRSGSEPPTNRTYAKGDEQTWRTDSSMQMTFDAPASAKILVNGIPVDFPAGLNGRYTLRIPEDLPDSPAYD